MDANLLGSDLWKFIFGSALGGGVVGFAFKWALERMSAEIEAKRRFTEKVTERIIYLAETHYWSLANHAGLLARLLESYSQERISRLLRWPDDWSVLRDDLRKLADSAGDGSFPYLCGLLGLFNRFQFDASNTYLFADSWAGERAKRLYNRFVDALREGGVETEPIIENVGSARPAEPGSAESFGQSGIVDLVGKPIAGQPPNQSIPEDPLEKTKQAYREWLYSHAESVARAAEALGAYSELLDYELKLLYRTWFKSKRAQPAGQALDVDFRDLPREISEAARRVINDARFESTMLSPLGVAGPGIRGPAAYGERAVPVASAEKVSSPNVLVVYAQIVEALNALKKQKDRQESERR